MRLAFSLLLSWLAVASFAAAVPDVDAIVRELGAKAEDSRLQEARAAVRYDRESRVDYLDDEEQVRKRVVRRYIVEPEDGKSVTRLISVNGKPATEKDAERKNQVRESGEKSRSLSLSADLLQRYQFTYLGEDTLNGRKAWMLRFQPRSDVETDGLFDRLVNAMSGVIWVDAEETQLAKAELRLSKKVSFFGGIAGAVERLDLTLVQRRIEPNIWLGESAFIDFSGRKLFSAMRFRCYETYSDFRRMLSSAVQRSN